MTDIDCYKQPVSDIYQEPFEELHLTIIFLCVCVSFGYSLVILTFQSYSNLVKTMMCMQPIGHPSYIYYVCSIQSE